MEMSHCGLGLDIKQPHQIIPTLDFKGLKFHGFTSELFSPNLMENVVGWITQNPFLLLVPH